MAEESITQYYKTNYRLQTIGFNIETVENMMPFERDIYYSIYIAEEKRKADMAEGVAAYKSSMRTF